MMLINGLIIYLICGCVNAYVGVQKVTGYMERKGLEIGAINWRMFTASCILFWPHTVYHLLFKKPQDIREEVEDAFKDIPKSKKESSDDDDDNQWSSFK